MVDTLASTEEPHGRDAKLKAAIEPLLIDVTRVANLCSCSVRHIYRLADSGKMPRPIKLGGLVRWDREDIVRWVADGCPPVAQKQFHRTP